MEIALRVLIVEDSESDTNLLLRELRKGGYDPIHSRVQTAENMRNALKESKWDLIISDYILPQFDAPAALKIYQESGLDIPFIVISGIVGEEIAVQMMKIGAHDYLIKGNMIRLVPAIRRELHEAEERRNRKKAEDANKKLAQALFFAEQRYRTVFNNASDSIFIYDFHGKILDINQTACDSLQYSWNELMTMTISQLDTPEFASLIPIRMEEIRKKGQNIFESAHLRKDRVWIPIEIHARIIQYADQEVILAIVRDITERKKAEEKILHLNRLYAVLSQVNQAIVHSKSQEALFTKICQIAIEHGKFKLAWIGMADSERKLLVPVAWSQGSENYLDGIEPLVSDGWNTGRPIVRNYHDFGNSLSGNQNKKNDSLIKLGCNSFISLPIRIKDKTIGSLNLYALESDFFTTEELGLLDEVASDISFALENYETEAKRKLAEQELQKTHQEIKQRAEQLAKEIIAQKQYADNILSSINDGVYSMDMEGRIVSWNQGAQNITGLQSQEVIGKYCWDVFRYLDINGNLICRTELCPFEEVCHTLKPALNKEIRALDTHGDTQIKSISATPLFNENNQLTGVVIIFRDISKEYELREKIRKASHAKSAFLANMSHEIRTPLNAILGFVQIMMRDSLLTSQQKEYLGIINRSGEHLLSLINDILEISKIEAGRITLNPTTFDLFAMLIDLEIMFRVRTDSKKLKLVVEKGEDVPRYVVTDENKLRQILINLMGNAIKFTETGGIALRIRKKKNDSKQVFLQMEVEDTGVGIAQEEMDKLFQYFEQTQSGKRFGAGTGLGLAISKEYIHIMGGDITATSQIGKGTLFRFEIEIKDGDIKDIQQKSQEQRRVIGMEKGQGPFRVLIVDDREENRTPLACLLALVGFESIEATNGKDAIEKFEKWSPDLILMDMRMPMVDGYEATRCIKQMEKGKNTPIIALTASAFEEDKEKMFLAGVNGYLRKPFKDREMFDTIGTFLNIRYLYEEKTNEEFLSREKDEKDDDIFIKERIALLPDNLVKEMHKATTNADIELLSDLIKQVEKESPEIAAGLHNLAQKYEYEKLIQLFQK